MEAHKSCKVHHDRRSLVHCGACGAGMCDECWRSLVENEPWCDACVRRYERRRRPSKLRPFLFFGTGMLLVGASVGWSVRRNSDLDAGFLICVAIATCVGAVIAAVPSNSAPLLQLRPRTSLDEPEHEDPEPTADPYRAGLRRVAHRVLPPVSGTWLALIILVSFTVSALLVPTALGLPR
jgi:uncharacterized protein (DUF983 family)